MIYTLSLMGDIASAIKHAFRILIGRIATLIYNLIINIYDLFMYISRAEILDNDLVQAVYQRVGMILGLFMLFKLTFTLIQALIDPNKLSDQKNGFGKIIGRCIFSIVLLGITPTIFREAFDIQNLIIGNENNGDNVLYKLIIGDSPRGDSTTFGRVLSSELYFSFYEDELEPFLSEGVDPEEGEADLTETQINSIKNKINDGTENFGYAERFLVYKRNGEYTIEFNEIFMLLVGGAVLWMLFMYCFQAAIRVFQLAYLQLIAPVPILSYISDPDGAFKKWIKQCTTTFLDLFIRLALIYFIVNLSSYVLEALSSSKSILSLSLGDISTATKNWVKIFLVVGLLLFAKKVPDLLKDLFPNLGGGVASFSMGLKPSKEVKGALTFGTGALIGAGAVAATGIKRGNGIGGKVAGAISGLGRGLIGARTSGGVFKNVQNAMNKQRKAADRAYERKNDDSTFWGRHLGASTATRRKEEFEHKLQFLKNYQDALSDVDKEIEKDPRVMAAQMALDSMMQTGKITKRSQMINKSTGKPITQGGKPVYKSITQNVTAKDIEAAQNNIKHAKEVALADHLTRNIDTDNVIIKMKNAEAIRSKGIENGYGELAGDSLIDTSISGTARATTFKTYKDTVKKGINNISGAGGSDYEKYEQAKANAKYDKRGN